MTDKTDPSTWTRQQWRDEAIRRFKLADQEHKAFATSYYTRANHEHAAAHYRQTAATAAMIALARERP